MKYISFDYYAIKEILSQKTLQSSDFREGKDLANFIKDGGTFNSLWSLTGVELNSGRSLVAEKFDQKRQLFIDKSKFDTNKTNSELINILQKVFRTCIRIWDKVGFSPCEKIIDSNLVAVYPHSFSTGPSYKVIIHRKPDSDRQSKRESEHLMIISEGVAKVSNEELQNSIYRLAVDETQKLKNQTAKIDNSNESKNSYISVIETTSPSEKKSLFTKLDEWDKLLTEQQRDFIFSESYGPDVLKGAAGTGKTLCLVLRCLNTLIKNEEKDNHIKIGLFTHSIASKSSIENIIQINNGGRFLDPSNKQSLVITTLQEWCIDNVSNRIHSAEYLDKDAAESKQTQLLYIIESLEDFMESEYKSSRNFISNELINYFEENDTWLISSQLQQEISTYIKGRAREDFESYLQIERSPNSIPLKNKNDFSAIFLIYSIYQEKLKSIGVFDSDDITITALLESITPIWKRRRASLGFSMIFIDETHLFNMNELSLFHNLLDRDSTNIIYTYDKSQNSGDSTLRIEEIGSALSIENHSSHKFNTMFRCSEDITNLAHCVLASGATLFSNLDNSLNEVRSSFTAEEEEKSKRPELVKVTGQEILIKSTFEITRNISRELGIKTSEVLIVPCSESLKNELARYATDNNLELQNIESRGDFSTVETAQKKKNSFLCGLMDYIGGLEFNAVVIVGANKDIFPKYSSYRSDHFTKYIAFNQLYVAITRAKYRLTFVVDKTKNVSELLNNAVEENLIDVIDTDKS